MRRRGLRYRQDKLEGDIEPNWAAQKSEAVKRMEQVDSMPADVRYLIHEFNTNPVVDAYKLGYRTVPAIRAFLTRARRVAS